MKQEENKLMAVEWKWKPDGEKDGEEINNILVIATAQMLAETISSV